MRLCKAKLNLFSSKVFIMKIKLTFVSGLEQSKVLGTTIAFSSTSRVFACETMANIVNRIFLILEYD